MLDHRARDRRARRGHHRAHERPPRRTWPRGRTYHVKFNPPKVEGKRRRHRRSRSMQREDDKEETVRKRLEVYQKPDAAARRLLLAVGRRAATPGAPRYSQASTGTGSGRRDHGARAGRAGRAGRLTRLQFIFTQQDGQAWTSPARSSSSPAAPRAWARARHAHARQARGAKVVVADLQADKGEAVAAEHRRRLRQVRRQRRRPTARPSWPRATSMLAS